ncbi:MAG: hypothetical protein CBB96_05545 [Gammaproteobacteria bacterium TMED36]|nr:MAG: hypothetical protein CBB96_08935 [Gammaproteobacteria bacterium TMED36]OUT94627.1 MAG: hypothetical protein CBB96_05545 [Gammaproteobacteria bacterium TMED36]|tara:strand:+ start:628 stop:816 length:189 start_codon:yes stop_codon:yes gene_type:complete
MSLDPNYLDILHLADKHIKDKPATKCLCGKEGCDGTNCQCGTDCGCETSQEQDLKNMGVAPI